MRFAGIVVFACLAWFGVGVVLAQLRVAQAPVIGQGGAAPGPPFVNRGSHLLTAGPSATLTPANSTCVSNPINFTGSDTAGHIFPDAGAVGPCSVNFAHDFSVDGGGSVSCVVSSSVTPVEYTSSPAMLIISWVGTTPNRISYFCVGVP
jgi:hypothetical protein